MPDYPQRPPYRRRRKSSRDAAATRIWRWLTADTDWRTWLAILLLILLVIMLIAFEVAHFRDPEGFPL